MKVTEIEFNWNVPYRKRDGSQDYKRTFRAPEHVMQWVPELGALSIDGRWVGTAGAVWNTEASSGRDQPSEPGSQARGAKQKR